MTADLILAAEAELDVSEAYDWYENRRHGLGEDFLTCIDACIQQICRAPEIHGKVYHDYRRALLRRFPYAIFYEYSGQVVKVYCVFHTSRSPMKWRERLN